MDLQTRKLELIKEFLKVQSEDVISRLENILKKESIKTDKEDIIAMTIEPMSMEELNERIDQSESDFRNNRFKKSSELLAKYE